MWPERKIAWYDEICMTVLKAMIRSRLHCVASYFYQLQLHFFCQCTYSRWYTVISNSYIYLVLEAGHSGDLELNIPSSISISHYVQLDIQTGGCNIFFLLTLFKYWWINKHFLLSLVVFYYSTGTGGRLHTHQIQHSVSLIIPISTSPVIPQLPCTQGHKDGCL